MVYSLHDLKLSSWVCLGHALGHALFRSLVSQDMQVIRSTIQSRLRHPDLNRFGSSRILSQTKVSSNYFSCLSSVEARIQRAQALQDIMSLMEPYLAFCPKFMHCCMSVDGTARERRVRLLSHPQPSLTPPP